MVSKLEQWVETMQKVEENIEKQIKELDESLIGSKQEKKEFIEL